MTYTKDQCDDLRALLASKGWSLLLEAARAECMLRVAKGVHDATNLENDVNALNTLRQVLAFEKGVEFVLTLAKELITRSERTALPQMVSPSRRGAL